jgi:hypothetical protein
MVCTTAEVSDKEKKNLERVCEFMVANRKKKKKKRRKTECAIPHKWRW